MDPNQTLWDILITMQRIGQSSTKQGILRDLDEVSTKVAELRIWIENGGFKPQIVVSIEELH